MRKNLAAVIIFVAAIFAVLPQARVQAQQPEDKSKRPSPPATTECTIKGKKVTISYSKPSEVPISRGGEVEDEAVPRKVSNR